MTLLHPQFLLLLLLLPLLVLLWYRRRGRVNMLALVLRLLIVTLLITALANPVVAQTVEPESRLVLVVDQSDSLGSEGQAALRLRAAELARVHTGEVEVLYFGAGVVAPPIGEALDTEPLQRETLLPEGTNIAAALDMARTLAGNNGRVVLLSDGGQTTGDALAAARAAGAARVPIDTLWYGSSDQPDSRVISIQAPPTLREGEEFDIRIVVSSSVEKQARLELLAGDVILFSDDVILQPGEQEITLPTPLRADQAGILSLRATLEGEPDTFVRNNSAAATVLVAPAPRVLLVEGQPGNTDAIIAALRPAGILAQAIRPEDLPSRLSDLDVFEGVVLVDVPATALNFDQMAALREFVRSEGRGLLATGGRASFTLGGYKDTPLEEVLPVEMTPKPRPERSDVTLLLIIDQSASMGPDIGTSKFNMAKEAAILATESLNQEDTIGVLAFDISQNWVVPFQLIGSGLSIGEIQERIGRLPLGGGTDIYAALEVGLTELSSQPGRVRHAVLLTDGRSFTSDELAFQRLIEQARTLNMTLSTIAIGMDADTDLLRQLAEWGAGRYHFADRPEDIPRLTLMESEIARTEPQVEGVFRAAQTVPHPVLGGFDGNRLPEMEGYVAVTPKPDAEMVLVSPEDDPVLAVWQYGLGRSVAWTPGIEAPWAPNWSNWPEYGQFWAQLIRYTLPEPDSGLLQVRAIPNGRTTLITADALQPGGQPLDLATTVAQVTLPDGTVQSIALPQIAPGRYAQEVRLSADGPYAIEVTQNKDSQVRRAEIGYVQRYPDEYVPVGDAGRQFLIDISAASGGQLLDALVAAPPPPERPDTPDAPGLWIWLLAAAALLWPLEIAARRGWLTRV